MSLHTFRGLHFKLRDETTDWNTVYACVVEDEYDLEGVPVEGKLLFDVGSHIGGVGVWSAARGARVVCVEPVPDNARLIAINAALNDVEVIVEEAAAGEEGQTVVRFGRHADETERHHAFIGNTHLPYEETEEFEQALIPSVSYTQLAERYGTPDVVKIDCEGGEWSWLPEMTDVPYIVGEWHPMPWMGTVYGRDDVVAALDATHVLEFSGPEQGPGGFRAVLR